MDRYKRIKRRHIIALWQIASGCLGAVYVLRPTFSGNVIAMSFNLIALGLCCLSAFVGVGLWIGRPVARPIAIVVQAAQIPRLMMTSITYSLMVGPEATFLIHGTTAHVAFDAGVRVILGFPGVTSEQGVGINLLPVIAILILLEPLAAEREVESNGSTTSHSAPSEPDEVVT